MLLLLMTIMNAKHKTCYLSYSHGWTKGFIQSSISYSLLFSHRDLPACLERCPYEIYSLANTSPVLQHPQVTVYSEAQALS